MIIYLALSSLLLSLHALLRGRTGLSASLLILAAGAMLVQMVLRGRKEPPG